MDDFTKAILIESKAKEALSSLLKYLDSSDISTLCYAYKYRVKKQEKLMEKKARKVEEKSGYEIESITDVVGLRLVTLFRHEMPEIIEKVILAILHEDDIKPNPFCKSKIEEIIIYSNNPEFDEIVREIKDNLRKYELPEINSPEVCKSAEGYSSIHVVTRVEEKVEELSEGKYYVPIEIQIRTVFEDAWGEIDHKYGYVVRVGKDKGNPISNAGYVKGHLKVLKKFSDACAEYADIIYKEASPDYSPSLPAGKIISVDADQDIFSRFIELEVPDTFIDKYQYAREEKRKAFEDVFSKANISKYMQAAESFDDVISEEECVDDGLSLLYYYSKMNEAVCLMTTNETDNVEQAHHVYLLLEEKYQTYPLIKMRMAQALSKLGRNGESLNKYSDAKECMQKIKNNVSRDVWTDELPRVDYVHMIRMLPKIYGFELWKKSRLIEDEENRIELIEKAYLETKEGYDVLEIDDDEKIKYINNLLYYAIDYLNQDPDSGSSFYQKVINEIDGYASELENKIDISQCEDIELLDTLALANEYLDNNEKAVFIANRVLDIALDDSSRFDTEVQLTVARNARRILKNG